MSVFPKTRAAAGYIAAAGPGELARARAAILLARLDACDDILLAGEGDVPAALHGLLRDLMQAVRDLVGPPGWTPAAMTPTWPRPPSWKPPPAPRTRPGPTRSAPGCCGHGSPRPPARMTPAPMPPASRSPARPPAARTRTPGPAPPTHRTAPHRTAVPGVAHPRQTDGPAGTGLT